MSKLPSKTMMSRGSGDDVEGDGLPLCGTGLREVYDKLRARAGYPVKIERGQYRGSYLDMLRNTYGCDIRYVGNKEYVLVGEWVNGGKDFVDYVKERYMG